LDSGVGTQMEIASGSPSRAMSVVASKRPADSASCSCSSETSFTWEWPSFKPSTTRAMMSKPSTRYPALASSTASGSPT
jgi:hypothetical protein